MMKPGYRTSEFWFTVVSFIFSGLYLLGIIGDNSQKEELIRDVSHGVESIILVGGQLAILYNYINSRSKIKQNLSGVSINERAEHTNNNRSNSKRTKSNNSTSQRKTPRSKKSSNK